MESFIKRFEKCQNNPVNLTELLQKAAGGEAFEESAEIIFYFLTDQHLNDPNINYWLHACLKTLRDSPHFIAFKAELTPILQKAERRFALNKDESETLLKLKSPKFLRLLEYTLEVTDDPSLKKRLLIELNKNHPSDRVILITASILKSENSELIHEALGALKLNGSPKIIPYLLSTALDGKNAQLQEYATDIIDSFPQQQAVLVFEAILNSKYDDFIPLTFRWIEFRDIHPYASLIIDLLRKKKLIPEILTLLRNSTDSGFIEPLESLKLTHPEYADEIQGVLNNFTIDEPPPAISHDPIESLSTETLPEAESTTLSLTPSDEEDYSLKEAEDLLSGQLLDNDLFLDQPDGLDYSLNNLTLDEPLTETAQETSSSINRSGLEIQLLGKSQVKTENTINRELERKTLKITTEKLTPLLNRVGKKLFKQQKDGHSLCQESKDQIALIQKSGNELKEHKALMSSSSDKNSQGIFSGLFEDYERDNKSINEQKKRLDSLVSTLNKELETLAEITHHHQSQEDFYKLNMGEEWQQITDIKGELEEIKYRLKSQLV